MKILINTWLNTQSDFFSVGLRKKQVYRKGVCHSVVMRQFYNYLKTDHRTRWLKTAILWNEYFHQHIEYIFMGKFLIILSTSLTWKYFNNKPVISPPMKCMLMKQKLRYMTKCISISTRFCNAFGIFLMYLKGSLFSTLLINYFIANHKKNIFKIVYWFI